MRESFAMLVEIVIWRLSASQGDIQGLKPKLNCMQMKPYSSYWLIRRT